MISVIIPVFNEEAALPGTLRALFSQPGDYEVIVVDGGSTDRTREVVQEFALSAKHSALRPLHLLTAPTGRAFQMNAGAKQAQGEWLLFLHADTILPERALPRLNQLETDFTVQAGGFMHQFSGDDWRLTLISFLNNYRCARSRIIYGDQALFVRCGLFKQLAGFPNQPILEDVAFCEKLIQVTNPLLLSHSVVTDSRKFVKMGVWRSFLRVLLIILHVEFHLPILPRTFFRNVR